MMNLPENAQQKELSVETKVGEGAAVMSVETRKREIPLLAAKIVLGANSNLSWHGKKDTVRVYFDDKEWAVHQQDYELAASIAAELKKSWVDLTVRQSGICAPSEILELVSLAQFLYARKTDSRAGKKGIIELSDNDGCGFWRMRLPAKFMPSNGWFVDITSAPVRYESLLEYDTIFVQRFHEWDSF
jgi:hypothetical protein